MSGPQFSAAALAEPAFGLAAVLIRDNLRAGNATKCQERLTRLIDNLDPPARKVVSLSTHRARVGYPEVTAAAIAAAHVLRSACDACAMRKAWPAGTDTACDGYQ